MTHAAVWAACCSYLSHNTPPELRGSAQRLLQLLHPGLGRGFGAIVGGLFVSAYGTVATFRSYGFLCTVVLGIFVFINFYRKDTGGFIRELPQEEDPHMIAEETSHLAPHGVPGGGMPRVSSNIRLEEQASQQQSQGFNPFNNENQQQYFIR